jgi:iduronate 2-sulfatase
MFLRATNSISILTLAFLSMLFSCQANDQKTTPPNVLMISIDDLNDWIGVLGVHPDVKTPNIDRLASEGILFTNAHCQAPICGPSRASVMSGLRPSSTGIYGQIKDQNLRKGSSLMESVRFLPQYFQDQGYKTIGVGKIFHNHAPKGVFEVSGGRVGGFGPLPEKRFKWNKKGTSTDWGPYPDQDSLMYDHSYAQWTQKQLEEKHDRPFFMAVGFIRPHVPWYAPKEWFDLYPPDQVTLPSYWPNDFDDLPEIAKRIAYKGMMPTTDWAIESGEWKNIVQAYLACVSFVDHQVGVVLDALEKSIYKNNTIVVLWSDHGYELGEKGSFGKQTLWSESTRVPLIFKLPGAKQNKKIDQAVELLDIYPTLLDLTGLEENLTNEGKSLVPLFEESADPSAVAITTYGKNNHSLVNRHYRYIIYEDGAEELYALESDPGERNNLSQSIDLDSVKKSMRSHLPKINLDWKEGSYHSINEYFIETSTQKK